MGRRRSRVTVPLVGVMVLTLGVGSGIYYVKARRAAKDKAAETAKAPAAPAAPVAKADPDAGALVTQTPAPLAATTPPATTEPVVSVTAPIDGGGAGSTTQPTTRTVVATTQPTGGPVVLPGDAAGVLAEGKAKIDAGDLVGGRKLLNDALPGLSATDATLAKRLMAEANRQIVFSQRRFANDPFQSTHTVQSGEKLQKIAATNAVSWEYLGRINGLTDPRRMRAGATLKTVQGPFHAVVSKSAFTMDIYLGAPGKSGSMYVTTLPVGLGANDSTPTGTWMAAGKLKNPAYFSPRGEGIIAADDPKNPLGEYWISLQGVEGQAVGKMSYGVHGTIDPDSVGKQSSMGCIRLRNDDIALVYELLVDGKSIVIVKE